MSVIYRYGTNMAKRYSYRCGAYPAPKHKIILAEIMGASMWCWVIYNVISEPEHLTGEFLWPDVKQWTDQELGIPPDDAE
ncbi:unnamed protein product [Nesidiocoris tenuis]|uniref:NADH dehydrogenase [ubiquinone] 1 beta subcomplex subunit 2, mitochondrial n=1 Tax=Nesidiocoris tenuis TaxID=355587 RepID=A0A6H5HAI0_9HEMI|nr:unnamed protein product [Nesidiocoris tenuis]